MTSPAGQQWAHRALFYPRRYEYSNRYKREDTTTNPVGRTGHHSETRIQ